jgi:hypothetical protein
MSDVANYSVFHGSEHTCSVDSDDNDKYVVPLFKLSLSVYIMKKIYHHTIEKYSYFEKQAMLGNKLNHIPELYAISVYFNSPTIDVIVFEIKKEKYVTAYLTLDALYTTNPSFFLSSYYHTTPIAYIHTSSYAVEINEFLDKINESIYMQKNITVANQHLSIPFFKYDDGAVLWIDPIDVIVPGIKYHATVTEWDNLISDPELFENGTIRCISKNKRLQPDIQQDFLKCKESVYLYVSSHFQRRVSLPYICPLNSIRENDLFFTNPEQIVCKIDLACSTSAQFQLLFALYKQIAFDTMPQITGVLVLYHNKNDLNGVILNGPDFQLAVIVNKEWTSFSKVADVESIKERLQNTPHACLNATINLQFDGNDEMCIYNGFVWGILDKSGLVIIPKVACIVEDIRYQNLHCLINPFESAKIDIPTSVSRTAKVFTMKRKMHLSASANGYFLMPVAKTNNLIIGEYPQDVSCTTLRFLSYIENALDRYLTRNMYKTYSFLKLGHILFDKRMNPLFFDETLTETYYKYFPLYVEEKPNRKRKCVLS